MNDPTTQINATIYALKQLHNGGMKPNIGDFDTLLRELPFLSKLGYEDFCEKVLPFDHYTHGSSSIDSSSGIDSSQTHVQLSHYLNEPSDMDSQQQGHLSVSSSVTLTGRSVGKPQLSTSPQLPAMPNTGGHTASTPSVSDNYSTALLRIHVVDEAKRRSQDFFCAKWLLVSKMKFFAAHLTDDSKPDDVDISVQCDVVIFDWLMKYVHKDLPDSQGAASLEAANVISILISSDFLQMDDLVSDCLNFIHANTEMVVSNSPANFNCISEIVLKRLAALFDIEELDSMKDKKDRLKSKLYMAKIEAMFTRTAQPQHLLTADSAHRDHLAQLIVDDVDVPDASTLFQCRVCQKILTASTHLLVPCDANQLQLTRWGEIVASHVPVESFDVNDYISGIYKDCRSWRIVFWRIWAAVQCLRCVRCRQWFRCIDFSSCWTHPEKATIDFYPCCRLPFRHFDPFSVRTGGCRLMDHLTDFQIGGDRTKRIYELLLRFRDPIVGDQKAQTAQQSLSQSLALDPVVFVRTFMLTDDNAVNKVPSSVNGRSVPSSNLTASSAALFDFSRFQLPTWNVDLSTRLNQDNQRQADYRIMREMCEYIVSRKAAATTTSPSSNSGGGQNAPSSLSNKLLENLPVVVASTAMSSSAKDVPGGFYARIENQMRTKVQALLAPPSRGGPRGHFLGFMSNSKQRPSSFFK